MFKRTLYFIGLLFVIVNTAFIAINGLDLIDFRFTPYTTYVSDALIFIVFILFVTNIIAVRRHATQTDQSSNTIDDSSGLRMHNPHESKIKTIHQESNAHSHPEKSKTPDFKTLHSPTHRINSDRGALKPQDQNRKLSSSTPQSSMKNVYTSGDEKSPIKRAASPAATNLRARNLDISVQRKRKKIQL